MIVENKLDTRRGFECKVFLILMYSNKGLAKLDVTEAIPSRTSCYSVEKIQTLLTSVGITKHNVKVEEGSKF